ATTPQDAVEVYQAIHVANPSGLDKAPKLDVNDPDSLDRLMEEGVSLFDTFQIAAEYDSVCAEWVENYPLTFDVAYPYLDAQIKEGYNLNKAVIHAFMKVLGQYPDTLIARKAGMQKAKEVSSMAQEVLDLGGLETSQGRRRLDDFDRQLRKQGNLLNPGTTADITSAALAVMVLGGYRP
ncbi:MAG: triphosphoribosyl-dephospho-CoA synthase, partial [Thermoproteota archaeon]